MPGGVSALNVMEHGITLLSQGLVEEVNKMEKCRKCGQEFELTNADKNLRKNIGLTVKLAGKMIEQVAPGLVDAIKDSKGCCNTCWHQATDNYTQAIMGALGQQPKKSAGPSGP